MGYRDDAIKALDMERFATEAGISPGPRVGDNEYRFKCPFHEDEHASANFNTETKLWYCHVCQEGGSPIDFLMRKGRSYKDALTEVGRLAGLEPPGKAAPKPARQTKSKLSETNVQAWHEAALRNADLMRWFTERRGFNDDTLERFSLGWDGERVTIPVRDETGKLVNVRRYLRDAKGEQGKMLPLVQGGEAATRLFPLSLPLQEEVILVEGEWDAMLMHQNGFTNALTVTSGAGIWKPEFTEHFKDRRVTIVYDNDEAGRKGSARVAAILSNVAEVRILRIPNLPNKGDVTDFFVEQGRAREELVELLRDATPYVVAPDSHDEPEARVVPLHDASNAKWRGQRLELPVLLSGKAMTPYTVPYKFTVQCDMSNKRFCSICPLQEANGRREVTLKAEDAAVLSLIGIPSNSQHAAIKALAKAIPQCSRPQVDVQESINIEELRIIPELDSGVDVDGDTEYVSRAGYFLGHGLLPNRSYRMRGYTHPHPKNQSTVHLLSEAEPSQDNISSFELTPEVRAQLERFGGDPEERWRDIYSDLTLNVHRIQDRFDMQVAYDLVWHSAISFYFNGAFVRRGWAESMVIGDSGQGKTEMAMGLLGHYRLGERVQGEQSSQAGLIGGLEKLGDTWMLGWGRIPLNDKRLLIVDETQGLSSEQIEAMSDVRATGIAEVTKIRTERTNARCRIIWLANPATGYTLAQHNQGVLAVKELFKKPEDVRRLDFALTVASGEVDFARSINVRHGEMGQPIYESEACRNLILWAWSRRPDQIVFTEEATVAILEKATEMGHVYHPAIPLVEPSDQRLKLARLAVAAAARTYSTDESGERVVVRPAHVAFVADYLDRIYNKPSMAYGEFSLLQRNEETLDENEALIIRGEMLGWQNAAEAINYFRVAKMIKRTDMADSIGWDTDYARAQVKYLVSKRLLKSVRDGWVKNPSFIVLLRQIASSGAQLVSEVPEEGDEF